MKFLNIKKRKKQIRQDGTTSAVMYFEEKSTKYGKLISSKHVGRTKNILISGGYNSGKSRILFRLWQNRREIWGERGFIKLSGLGSIAEFVDTATLRNWYNAIPKSDNPELIEFFNANEGREFKRLRQHERIENLILFIKHNNTVLLVDDANRLTNRKLEIVKRCIEHCSIFVIATTEEQRLATSLRTVVMHDNIEHIKLDTKASYDMTSVLIYIIIAAAAVGGWYELAVVMGGLKALSSGRGSTRKD